ncbi:RHS repeat-associated core domain-containing protein, partial [Pectobacterium parmentieri]|uniref:RHS repeat-associated core domain-containing protein n=1 Tax=Pectobacterium parmentieri TaxID=1905730 RepID=UPI00217E8B99
GDAANEEVYCELRYQGQLYDAETGLCYNRHRYYDAESGQYLSPDPIGLLGGIRPQAYVHNPLEWVDPLGLAEQREERRNHTVTLRTRRKPSMVMKLSITIRGR